MAPENRTEWLTLKQIVYLFFEFSKIAQNTAGEIPGQKVKASAPLPRKRVQG